MSKTALITGASGGIGKELVKLFIDDGYDLVLVARSVEKLMQIKQENPNASIKVIAKDLSQDNSVKELCKDLVNNNIIVDVLVNNAGFGLLGEFDALDIETQKQMIQLNIMALTELTHFIVSQMKKRKRGKILNVASTAAFQPGPLMAVYFATKAYVLSLSEALVEELKGSGVTVTTLCPGPTKTNFWNVAKAEKTMLLNMAMEAQKVAVIGYNGLMKGKRVVIAGSMNKVGVYSTKFFPRAFTTKITKKMVKGKKH